MMAERICAVKPFQALNFEIFKIWELRNAGLLLYIFVRKVILYIG